MCDLDRSSSVRPRVGPTSIVAGIHSTMRGSGQPRTKPLRIYRERLPSAACLTVVLAAVWMAYRGLGLSLWNDEAWLANSGLAADLRGMFFYDHWLQVTPPGFLLVLRFIVSLGYPLSNTYLHLLPFAAGLVGLVAMWKV